MKIEIYVENGAPLLVFSHQIERDKTTVCYCRREGHSSAARGYLRTLSKPETPEEIRAAWQLLAHYATLPG